MGGPGFHSCTSDSLPGREVIVFPGSPGTPAYPAYVGCQVDDKKRLETAERCNEMHRKYMNILDILENEMDRYR